jgi:hypothetical protein
MTRAQLESIQVKDQVHAGQPDAKLEKGSYRHAQTTGWTFVRMTLKHFSRTIFFLAPWVTPRRRVSVTQAKNDANALESPPTTQTR